MTVKINTLEIENVKRIKSVALDCSGKSLTVIGGKNGQGKTSVLDAIAYALGGRRNQPSVVKREESVIPGVIKVTLSNGFVVERKGKNSELKVTDPSGGSAGQALLNSFVNQFALNLPRFLDCSDKEKSEILLKVVGVGDELQRLENDKKRLYDERHAIGIIADQKRKAANELPDYSDAPVTPVSTKELVAKQHAIIKRNEEIKQGRMKIEYLKQQMKTCKDTIKKLGEAIKNESDNIGDSQVQSTVEIEETIAEAEENNIKARANLDKEKASDDAAIHERSYRDITVQLENVRSEKLKLLDDAEFPLPDLSVEDGKLTYEGKFWDCMSSADQLRVATAISRKLNPECGFVLIDKLEQMDLDSLSEFGVWLETEGLQAIATRVSTGNECSIIIEDGIAVENKKPTFEPGVF